jgi:hypothetical protein
MKLKRLSADDFDRIAAHTRMEERTKQLAREVLVDGDSPSDVAARSGFTKQRIGLAVGVIEKAYFANEESGQGWVTLELELPETLGLQLDDIFGRLKASGDKAKLQDALQIIRAALKKTGRMVA